MTAEHRRIFTPKVYDDLGKTESLVYLESTADDRDCEKQRIGRR